MIYSKSSRAVSAATLLLATISASGPPAAAQQAPVSALDRPHLEGELGVRGVPQVEVQADGTLAAAPDPELCPAATNIAYRFAGVSDDGAKGSSTRKEATALLCQNIHSANTLIKYQIFQWNGSIVAEGCLAAAPNQNYTFSTQNTTIYFDDLILGEGGGTDSIFQGAGVVLTDGGPIICSAQVLDPLNHPPTFAVALEMSR